ncbi:SpaH/EbpB family LPXTG-anchored major pilin [Enterococcus gilvus]|uniref:SpaH/EbpB family LPXTG-anchored major pilin n=1 Tax=Enterococcus gilvus TaxID=160453 RepID=UPI001C8B6AD0|nr:SpaH/EbpB family LPXTG-anchored major pilin [Enterococcus gilvus]MBX8938396.1 SpaH/EbpB family LPXTG-anchored major pilin [Enterococcus gilvus]
MKARGRFVSLLMALVCLLPVGLGLLSAGDSAYAADTVDVTLHKKEMDEWPNEFTENTGKEDESFNRYNGLPDITFSVWDITDHFYEELNKELPKNYTDAQYKEAAKKVMNAFQLDTQKDKKAQAADQVTNDEGLAYFTGLEKRNSKGLYNVYFFEEQDKDNVEKGAPLILTLPVIDVDTDKEIESIHLYPKNKVKGGEVTKEIVDPEGPNADGEYDYDIGKKVQFKATFKIPSQIGQTVVKSGATSTRYTKMVFQDEVTQEGLKFEGIEKIVVDGQPINMDTFKKHATITPKGDPAALGVKAGFEIKTNLNDATDKAVGTGRTNYEKSVAAAKYFEQYAGKRMEFYYSVSMTELTPVDVEIENQFKVFLDHDDKKDEEKTHPDLPTITTGGRKFFKFEDPNGQGLQGADFIVIKKVNGSDHYLTIENGVVKWERVTDDNYVGAKHYVSDDHGEFEVTGLEYGEYHLREVKAPNGFQKLPADEKFEISKGVYSDTAQSIANTAKGGILPSTGGAGIIAFLIIGGALMSIAVIRYRKSQHAA